MNETAIWEKALSLLRDEMSEPSFDTWIAPLNVLRQRGDAVYRHDERVHQKAYPDALFDAHHQRHFAGGGQIAARGIRNAAGG